MIIVVYRAITGAYNVTESKQCPYVFVRKPVFRKLIDCFQVIDYKISLCDTAKATVVHAKF